MPLTQINVGTTANDGTGDTVRAAFQLCNTAFTAVDARLPLAGGTLTGQILQSTNGAASTPPVLLSGTIFTGGSATTTKPAHLIEPTGTTSTAWSTSGTIYGGNAPSGFTGNLLDLQVNGSSKARLTADGKLQLNGSNVIISNGAVATLSLDLTYNGGRRAVFGTPASGITGLHLYEEEVFGWCGGALAGGAVDDIYINRVAASVLGLRGASSAGGALEMMEMTAPSAPAANKARIYAQDNGAGKTQLMVLFPSGAAQQIAIEP